MRPDRLTRDVRRALRTAARRPGFSAAVVLTLALGIGGNVAVFSLVQTLVLRPLPYAEPGQLYSVLEEHREGGLRVPSYPTFQDWGRSDFAFANLAFARGAPLTFRTDDQAGLLLGAFVTDGFFETMRVSPLRGRALSSADYQAGADNAVVVSERAWRRWLGADPGVIGSTLVLDQRAFTVIGVMPASFAFPDWGADNDLWLPITRLAESERVALMQRGFHADSRVVGRVDPDVGVDGTQQRMDARARALAEEYPETAAAWTSVRLDPLRDREIGALRPRLFVLWGAVGFVLLLCCLNLANLYTVHGRSRRQEYAVRAALGAGRARVTGEILIETAVLTATGALAGVGLAGGAVRWARETGLRDLPRINELAVDGTVLAFAVGLSATTAVLFTLIAASHISESPMANGRLNVRGPSWRAAVPLWLQSAQVAITFVLLVGAALLLQTFVRLSQVDPGYDPKGLMVVPINPPSPTYDDENAAIDLYRRVIAAIEGVPGVTRVALTNHGPGGLAGAPTRASIGGPPEPGAQGLISVRYRTISAGYFDALGIRLVEGREFTQGDLLGGEGPVIVNEALARRWGGESPLGETLGVLKAASTRTDFGEPLLGTVIGVVQDLDVSETGGQLQPIVYVPFTHTAWAQTRILARASTPARMALREIELAVWSVDPSIPLTGPWVSVRSMDDLRAAARYEERFNAALVGSFALIALLLAAIGMYGVISYTVSLQTRAMGVRLALGATPRSLSRSLVGRVARITSVGLILGWATSLVTSRVVAGQLAGVASWDPGVFAAAAIVLLAIALAAGYVPANRAGRLDPVAVLRSES